jgi:acyl-CoA synthetase (AMP-forming)/AMP-acid ligase II
MASRASSDDVGLYKPPKIALWGRPDANTEYRGYANNEEATRNTFAGDWLRTGDIMKVDEHGNFYVTDRLKEVS